MARLKQKYLDQIAPAMMAEFGYKNKLQVPRVTKVVINMGVKEGVQDVKIIDQCAEELTMITGQKAVITRARKSISNFKIREGQPVGVKVTLRGKMMYEFIDRLISIAMPRIKDFQGVSDKSFDQGGNFAMGLTEQIVFPEINFDKVKKIQGMDIVFVTTAKTREEAKKLLQLFGMPFRRK
ncbi:MAG: 50S ribosomal protein L5 [Candidatus Omnitrophica bacterium]|nr:50S ribosomal protein L5 [Candidatus Omnitrophota bacterium]